MTSCINIAKKTNISYTIHQYSHNQSIKSYGNEAINKLDVEKSTGYILGGVSPLDQKKMLKTVIDSQAKEYATIFVSAGRRGLEIELKAEDLRNLTNGIFREICQ